MATLTVGDFVDARTGSARGTQELATLIREAREAKGLSQYDLAKEIGRTRGFVSHLEAGRSAVTTEDTATALSVALGLTNDEIFAAGRVVDDTLYRLLADATPGRRAAVRAILTSTV